jgi:hypothetical protein
MNKKDSSILFSPRSLKVLFNFWDYLSHQSKSFYMTFIKTYLFKINEYVSLARQYSYSFVLSLLFHPMGTLLYVYPLGDSFTLVSLVIRSKCVGLTSMSSLKYLCTAREQQFATWNCQRDIKEYFENIFSKFEHLQK